MAQLWSASVGGSSGHHSNTVVETVGVAKAKKVRPIAIRGGKPGEQIDLPVEFRKVNRPSRSAIRKIFREKNNMILSGFFLRR